MGKATSTFSPDAIAHALLATPPLLRSLLRDQPPALYAQRQADGGWSINEVVGHLIAADHVAFAQRITLMLEQEHPLIPAINVDQIAQERQDHLRDLGDLLDELAAQRQPHAALIRSLRPAQLARTGHNAKHGDFQVADFVYEWAYHDYAHVQQILTLLKMAIWPHFSPTMQQALGTVDG